VGHPKRRGNGCRAEGPGATLKANTLKAKADPSGPPEADSSG
jgi:hypothetical protein